MKGLRLNIPPVDGCRGGVVIPGPELNGCEPGEGLDGVDGVEKERLPRLPMERPPPARAQAADSSTSVSAKNAIMKTAKIAKVLLVRSFTLVFPHRSICKYQTKLPPA